jgi:general secretion pathway protein J
VSTRTPVAITCRGFTLLELLVALSIFGLLATMSYSGLQAVMRQQSQTEVAADRLGELQKLYLIMQRDIEQVVPRPIRDEFGDEQPSLLGGENFRLTRAGWRNPAGRQRSTLQRVGYAYEDDQLVRYTWSVLDRAQDSEPLVQPLTDAVEQLQIRYLGVDNEWKEQWPDAQAVAAPAVGPAPFPKAVEVTVEHEMYGPIVWLFQLPQ